jgi:hypothetical protein
VWSELASKLRKIADLVRDLQSIRLITVGEAEDAIVR